MKPLTIAFLFNIRHRYPDPNDPRSQREADFDDPETIKAMVEHLKKAGFKVIPIEADENAYPKLKKFRNKIDIAFNYSEGIHGADREAHSPAILEMLGIPYTGSGPLTQSLVLNKAKTKEILRAHKISTPRFQIFKTGTEKISRSLHFPLIVKPQNEGSSAGITNRSIVNNEIALRRQIKFIHRNFHQPALVETFLPGREFSVAMFGNPPTILPIIEADHSSLPKRYQPLDSLEVKWEYEEGKGQNHLICPAELDRKLRRRLIKLCLRTWQALDVRDYCRIDLRCDEKNRPYVLEVNSPPGLLPPEISTTSYFPLAASRAGINYTELMRKIILTAKTTTK